VLLEKQKIMSVPGEIKILISWEIQIIYAPREKKK